MPIETRKSVYTCDWVNYFSAYLSLKNEEKLCKLKVVIVNNNA